MDGSSGLTGMGDMESSFKAFLQQPENQAIVEARQRKEALRAARAQERQHSRAFQRTVISSGKEAQANVARFLAVPALRRVIATFQNDPTGRFSDWATNPEVLAMLGEAKHMVDEGSITMEELDRGLLMQFQAATAGDTEAKEKAEARTVRLPIDQLVGALNEHLTERRQGNEKYKAGDLDGALGHYERALAIVDYVRGTSDADQGEVDSNKVAVLLNIAAVAMARHEYNTAAQFCSGALALQPRCPKALLRRAKASIGRHEYQAAQADLAAVLDIEPGSIAATDLLEDLQEVATSQRAAEKQRAASMLAAS